MKSKHCWLRFKKHNWKFKGTCPMYNHGYFSPIKNGFNFIENYILVYMCKDCKTCKAEEYRLN